MKLPAAIDKFFRGLTAWLSIHHSADHGALRGNQENAVASTDMALPMRTAAGCLAQPLRWQSVGGELKVNDAVFHLKVAT